jgi:acyl-CoA synthetase (AMP-forming)/AMP-acid ligase II
MSNPRDGSLAAALARFASQHPAGVAVIDAAPRTWAELHELALRYEAAFDGVRGATDVVFLPASGDALALLAASERAGQRAILVAPPYSAARAHAVAVSTHARRVVTADGDRVRVLAELDVTASTDGVAPAVLVLTSGTSGPPKCAVHTWSTLSAAVRYDMSDADRRWLVAYPLSHFAGLQVLLQCVLNRDTLVIPSSFGATSGLAALRDHGVTHLCATPTYVRQLLMSSAPEAWCNLSLRHVTLGGEIVDQQLLDSLRSRRPDLAITHMYASTEVGTVLSVRDGREGFDVSLVDDTHLAIRDGELFVRRSARSMLAYAAAVAPAGDDWVATGDLVEVRGGRVLFRGRASDVINVGGFKVHPADVEAVIREVPGVRDVCVVGRKSSIAGHLVKAIVCTAPGVDRAALQAAIAQRCNIALPRHMVPRLFEMCDELPRTAAQKLSRTHSADE